MFEPLTQTVGQLALRWNYSVRDVLTHAVQRNWPLYFYFDGLVIDVNDRANRFGGCRRQEYEADLLEKAIERAEETLARSALHAQGKLEMSRFEQVLDQDAALTLRATIEEDKRSLNALRASIEAWHEDRQRFHRNGAVRAAPATLQGIADSGVISFPIRAYHPESPTWFIPNPDGPGQLLEGRLVALEDMGPNPKEKLTVEDIFADMVDVKAIEAANIAMIAVAPPEVGKKVGASQQHERSPLAKSTARLPTSAALQEEHQVSAMPTASTSSEEAIPGKPPKIGAGRVAIEVAWALERELGHRPTAKRVMTRLRELANNGNEFADILRKTSAEVQGVNWITKKGKAQTYSDDALVAALGRWMGSRQ